MAGCGLSGPLARMTADRFELLLSQRLILRDLDAFIDGRIRRIHGRRVADLLQELLTRRIEAVETALEGLRLQYPGYAEELERRFIRRTALRLEEREYAAMREDGLIGAEVYTTLMQDLGARRAAAEHRPRLDIAVRRAELVRQFPLFADLEDAALRRLGRALQTRYVNAGDVDHPQGQPGKKRFLHRLGRGRAGKRGTELAAGPRRDVRADGDPDAESPAAPRSAPSRPRRCWCSTRCGSAGCCAAARPCRTPCARAPRSAGSTRRCWSPTAGPCPGTGAA